MIIQNDIFQLEDTDINQLSDTALTALAQYVQPSTIADALSYRLNLIVGDALKQYESTKIEQVKDIAVALADADPSIQQQVIDLLNGVNANSGKSVVLKVG